MPIVEIAKIGIILGAGLLLVVLLLAAILSWSLLHAPRLTAGVAAAAGWWLDPGDADLDFEEWQFRIGPKMLLPVWDIANPQCPDGPLVIISHSWGGSRLSSLQRVPFVLNSASRVILWDMRGHGDAEGGINTLGTAEAGDLIQLIDHLNQSGAERRPIVLYGYSMGAGVSIVVASKRPEQVIGVIADGTYRWTAEPVRSVLRHFGLPAWPTVPITQRLICWFITDLRGSDRARYAARLQCPLLMMHGTDDHVCSVQSALEISEAAPSADFIVLPNAEHLDLHIAHPERYERTVRNFIDRCMSIARERRVADRDLFQQ